MAEKILMREYRELSKEKWVNVELLNSDILTWSIALIILNPSSLYYGGYFLATLSFPSTYPYTPPTFQFTRPLYHPNIYPDGKLCISILHSPGDDEMSGESAGERWSPVQRVESVLLSIISLLDDAETSSPANVDAGVQLRMDKPGYKKRVREDVEKSKADIPSGFVMPTHESTMPPPPTEKPVDDREFWVDSDADDDGDDDGGDFDDDDDDDDDEGGEDGFGGSDTDEDVLGADEEEEEEEEDDDDDDDEDFKDDNHDHDHDEAQKQEQKRGSKDDNAAPVTTGHGAKSKKKAAES